MHTTSKIIFLAIASAIVAAAQNPISADAQFQVAYASNLTAGDSVINITNTGTLGASRNGPGFGGAVGNICVNVYALDPGEELVACCSCLITPDALASLSVVNDLIANTETGSKPTSAVIKLIAVPTGGTGTGTSCSHSAAFPPATGEVGVEGGEVAAVTVYDPGVGLAAWRTTLHASPSVGFAVTETPFTPSTLSVAEADSLANRCRNIIGNASGAGICNSCKAGGLGASKSGL